MASRSLRFGRGLGRKLLIEPDLEGGFLRTSRVYQFRNELGLTLLLASAVGKPACQIKPSQKRRG